VDRRENWQQPCSVSGYPSQEEPMLTSTRSVAVASPRGLHTVLVPAVTLSAFLWLLAGDAIAPLAMFALQLFLSF